MRLITLLLARNDLLTFIEKHFVIDKAEAELHFHLLRLPSDGCFLCYFSYQTLKVV